jgi:hypothetical protein
VEVEGSDGAVLGDLLDIVSAKVTATDHGSKLDGTVPVLRLSRIC